MRHSRVAPGVQGNSDCPGLPSPCEQAKRSSR
jgi:hypothetical protein